MPTYCYECPKCHKVDEIVHKMDETPTVTCYGCREIKFKIIGAGQFTIVPYHMKAVNHDTSKW